MNDEKLMSQAVYAVFHADSSERPQELTEAIAALDSIDNLNTNPLALRSAGFKAARYAYVMGAKWGMAQSK